MIKNKVVKYIDTNSRYGQLDITNQMSKAFGGGSYQFQKKISDVSREREKVEP